MAFACIKMPVLNYEIKMFLSLNYLEELCLEPGEGAANPEVEFLSGVHGAGLILVGGHQR